MGTNLATVIGFEITRTLKSKGFWIAGLIVPILFAGIIFISQASARSADTGATGTSVTFQYVDASGLVDPQVAAALGGTAITDAGQGLKDVQEGRVDAFINVPADPVTQPVSVAGADRGLLNNDVYTSLATSLLQQSAATGVGNQTVVALVAGDFTTDVTTYKGSAVANSMGEFLPPLIFLAAFYLVLLIQSNRMLGSSLEEKENRVTEMILTTIKASSLLAGKVFSLIVTGIIQMLLTIVPSVVVVLVLRHQGKLGGFDLSGLVFDPQRMVLGTLLLISGFLLFTAGLVAIGAAMPSAKDAQSMFTIVMLVLVCPLFIITLIMTNPSAPLVQAFTYIPVTAPMTAMLRNALGSLSWLQGLAVTVIVLVSAWLVFQAAVRVYQYGSVEYSRKVSFKAALQRM